MKGDDGTRLGVDTGGTFTDVIKHEPDGTLTVHKLLSTPDDPSRAIGDGVAQVGADGAQEVVHGTTVATNALLERQGARLAFVTTAGFEDLLWMRRQARPELYALRVEVPSPLVDQGYCFGVQERLDSRGEVIEALTDGEVRRVVEAVAEVDADAVVICLLHAYANRSHEQRLAEAFRAHDTGWHVTASCEVTATFREYERASTATVNGFVGPVMGRYLERLDSRLQDVDRLEVLQSHGGRAGAEHAGRLPVHTVLSGPAGGVVGAVETAREVGCDKVISFDMGGTSTDVSLAAGKPTLTEEASIGGHPLQVPVIDIYTVGAGGGSIAYVDAGGALRVGPQSAGADPGPAAYDRGGDQPTVTDAHVVLGSLRPDRFLGGHMDLDRDAANEAVEKLGSQLGTSPKETARGILDVADAAMARAIKVISLERGHDPRDYALVSFGGAGGLHACRLARALDMSTVVVPRFPGLLSAAGMLRSDERRLYSRSILRSLTDCLTGDGSGELRSTMKQLEQQARQAMGRGREMELNWTASLRYEGQSFSISVDVDWGAHQESWSDPTEAFEREHDRLYGYRAQGRNIELVDLRLQARREAAAWPATSEDAGGGPVEETDEAVVDLGDGPTSVQIIERADLRAGDRIEGPAIIAEYSGTTVVFDGWRAKVADGHLLIRRRERP